MPLLKYVYDRSIETCLLPDSLGMLLRVDDCDLLAACPLFSQTLHVLEDAMNQPWIPHLPVPGP